MDQPLEILLSKKYRIVMHLAFWLAVVVFYTLFFGQQGEQYLRTLIFVMALLVITISTAYFVNYFLLPRYLFSGRFRELALYSVFTFVVSVWLESLVILGLVTLFVYRRGIILDQTAINFVFMVVGMYFIIFIAVSIKLLKSWYEKQHSLQAVAREKLEAELKLLKSQIHPHFLFNTLNNIYALALRKSDSAPEMILKLSAILDYLLYECDVPYVPLKKEIELINNYISLEKIRYAERLDLEFNIQGEKDSVRIAPLILLPFVENSFKHGAGKKRLGVWIRIDVRVHDKELDFTIENNKSDTQAEGSGGIGLANVKQRLDLTYQGKYQLDIENKKDTYRVHLKMQLL